MPNALIDLRGKRGLIPGIANEPHVHPLAEALQCPLVLPCDVRTQWGSLVTGNGEYVDAGYHVMG
jgi:hypothetical protein